VLVHVVAHLLDVFGHEVRARRLMLASFNLDTSGAVVASKNADTRESFAV
jgi:hypothetical protein